MTIEELLKQRKDHIDAVSKIDRNLWNSLKNLRCLILKYNKTDGKKIYQVLKLRLGERKSLEEIASGHMLTRERVRQIESMGLELCKKIQKLEAVLQSKKVINK